MLPGLGGFDPKKMNALMKQMGISQDEIPASKVIIETSENKRIIIENPSVTKINMQGHDSFQVIGDVREEIGTSEDDIKTIMERTGCTQKQAKKALEKTGDLAEAILELSD